MLKALLTGIALGAGLMVGVGAIGFIGMHYVAGKMEVATQRATDGLERANASIEREFPAPVFRHNLEAYRACLHANDEGNVSATIDACRDEFRKWEEAPQFALELEKLQITDIRAAEIMTAYDNVNSTKYFD
ncbi:hypothetical protein [Rhizobium sp. PL01]|uniref:hypothetical protein n=1 Tax=Rhizobium sp. PL01 TaxID=3085631 RepID=UPI0029815595|nr:hypothetical protein [Rhizobium sp. PL01]MDW5313671.1 hypothetical protein [Rhizobium sp. PL01]